MSPVRARTRTVRSGVERTNHEATAPPTTLVRAHRKRPLADTRAEDSESDDSDVVPPTPKRKAVVTSLSASVSSASDKPTAPSQPSAAEPSETSYDPPVSAPSMSHDPVPCPSTSHDAVPGTSTS